MNSLCSALHVHKTDLPPYSTVESTGNIIEATHLCLQTYPIYQSVKLYLDPSLPYYGWFWSYLIIGRRNNTVHRGLNNCVNVHAVIKYIEIDSITEASSVESFWNEISKSTKLETELNCTV